MIELLIGLDILQVHYVSHQVIGDKGQPCADRLLFGWGNVGEEFIEQVHAPREVNVLKTQNPLRWTLHYCSLCVPTISMS